jgi:hypothetical protein
MRGRRLMAVPAALFKRRTGQSGMQQEAIFQVSSIS